MNPFRSFRTRGATARSAPLCFPLCAVTASPQERARGRAEPRRLSQGRTWEAGPRLAVTPPHRQGTPAQRAGRKVPRRSPTSGAVPRKCERALWPLAEVRGWEVFQLGGELRRGSSRGLSDPGLELFPGRPLEPFPAVKLRAAPRSGGFWLRARAMRGCSSLGLRSALPRSLSLQAENGLSSVS